MPGALSLPNKAVGMANGAPRMPTGGAPGVPFGTEAGAAELPRAADPAEHAAVLACVRAAGYRRAEIDERPLRSGSLNLDITPVSSAG